VATVRPEPPSPPLASHSLEQQPQSCWRRGASGSGAMDTLPRRHACSPPPARGPRELPGFPTGCASPRECFRDAQDRRLRSRGELSSHNTAEGPEQRLRSTAEARQPGQLWGWGGSAMWRDTEMPTTLPAGSGSAFLLVPLRARPRGQCGQLEGSCSLPPGSRALLRDVRSCRCQGEQCPWS